MQYTHKVETKRDITCWAPNLLAFALLGSLKYLLGNSLGLYNNIDATETGMRCISLDDLA